MDNASPSPLNPPVYAKLKELHLATDLVRDGQPAATIVVPRDGSHNSEAALVQAYIKQLSGVDVPVATDEFSASRIPIQGNLILLGNRSTNATIGALYDLFYTLLDLRYPGPGGHVVRTLHNPFGNGRNVVFLGGSDPEGVAAATSAFCATLSTRSPASGNLQIGRLAEIQLGDGIAPPDDIRDVEVWEASPGYKSTGYFGWTSISKHMALYYMTGDEFHAREVLRLSFPDNAAKQDIADVDGELIENKDEPLSGPYHYGALMLILFWDLIEESPVFSDSDRLRITNAFSKQLAHPQERGWREEVYARHGVGADAFSEPPAGVGDRHELWSHVCLYALSRYFQNYYPHSLWEHCIEGARWYFSALHRHWCVHGLFVSGGSYSSSMAPILTYVLLSGDRRGVESGVLRNLLLGQEILTTGQDPEPALGTAAIDFLHKAAYITQDGRFLEYLRRTGMDLTAFRVGQSYWPEPLLQPEQPADLVGQWTMLPMPEPMWQDRAGDCPLPDSYVFGSLRSSVDASGDYVFFETYKGFWWDLYHTFKIAALRLDGRPVLAGTLNHVLVRMDGMMPAKVSMDSAIRAAYVLGGNAVLTGEASDAGHGRWQRTLVLRERSHALVIDRATFTGSSENAEVELLWQGPGQWSALTNATGIRAKHDGSTHEIRVGGDLETTIEKSGSARMVWRGEARSGDTVTLFSLIARTGRGPLACRRLNDHAAALQLPGPGLVVADGHEGIMGELVVLTDDRVHGKAARRIDVDHPLLEAEPPADCDWDLETGVMEVSADEDTLISCALVKHRRLTVDGVPQRAITRKNGTTTLSVPAGRHVVRGARPAPQAMKALRRYLRRLQKAAPEVPARREPPGHQVPTLPTLATLDVGGPISGLVTIPDGDQCNICVAEGERVHVWALPDGQARVLAADSPVQVLHWWAEHELLLAGCKDGTLVAFDIATGRRRWTFLSEMDPAVLQAAKPYWFRSAKGHEGIHGLHSGAFLSPGTQAFVGSACTLEIIDGEGELLRRLPVFWGPGKVFALVDKADGTVDLLVGREPADTHAVVVVNSRDEYVPNMLGPDPRSFHDVPPGHTDPWTWGDMIRHHIIYDDIDGDGHKEVVGDITGAWNRVTVWSSDATPLYNAHFGPGPGGGRSGPKAVRGLKVADLDGSGRKAILAATRSGWVVALNHECRKIWARRLADTPALLRIRATSEGARVVVACETGAIQVLDQTGNLANTAQVSTAPVGMEVCPRGVVVATQSGVLEVLEVD